MYYYLCLFCSRYMHTERRKQNFKRWASQKSYYLNAKPLAMDSFLVLTNFYISIFQNNSQATLSNYHFISSAFYPKLTKSLL